MMGFFFSDEVRRNPYPWYEQVRSASPVLRDPDSDTWMLFDYASVRRAMDDHESFSSRVTHPGGRAPEWLVFLDPPRHTQLRAIVGRAFTPRAIAALEPRIRELSRELLDRAAQRGEVDLVAEYSGPLPAMVIAEMMGIPLADRPRFMRWSQAIVNLGYAIMGGEEGARAAREYVAVREEMTSYLMALIGERRLSPRDDLLTRLVQGEVDGEGLSDADILGFFQLLLSAATETTTNLIDNAVISFAENPDQLARLRESPGLMASAIEEVVRYRSPGQIMFRQSTRDVTLHGQTIPANRFVLVMIGSANRDAAQFASPDRFDIGRNPNPHIAFGHGIHFCLGAALARLEAKVALSDLLLGPVELELVRGEPWEPRQALHVHGPASLNVRLRSGTTAGVR
jgi:cytochrome P450